MIMENVNKGNRGQQDQSYRSEGSKEWNDQNQVTNSQDQNRSVNTGDEDFKENVAGRTPEQSPRDLNLSGGADRDVSQDSEGGAEIETPHRHEGDDEESTEKKIPKM